MEKKRDATYGVVYVERNLELHCETRKEKTDGR